MAYQKQKFQNREEEKFDANHERELFYAALDDKVMQEHYKQVLGPSVPLPRFLQSARDAVEGNPSLLAPSMRSSLLFAVKKAATQGLRPDGKQGALVPRYDRDAKQKLIFWNPMVQGILLAGRRAKMLKAIVSVDFVLVGEPFKFLKGDDPKIIHEWDPQVRRKAYSLLRRPHKEFGPEGPMDGEDAGGPNFQGFWDMIVAGYAVLETPDGDKIRRAMDRERILLLRDFSKAKGGPWFSVWFDEMIIKSQLLFAMKHAGTEAADELSGNQFRDALEQDMEAELFDGEDDNMSIGHSVQAALPAPDPVADKLSKLEMRFGPRETVPAEQPSQQQKAVPPTVARPQEQPPQPPAEGNLTQQQASHSGQATNQYTDEEKKDAAKAFTDSMVHEIRKAIETGKTDEMKLRGVSLIVANPRNQKAFQRLKVEHKAQYNRILDACTDHRVADGIMREVQTAYESFYFDLLQRLEDRQQSEAA